MNDFKMRLQKPPRSGTGSSNEPFLLSLRVGLVPSGIIWNRRAARVSSESRDSRGLVWHDSDSDCLIGGDSDSAAGPGSLVRSPTRTHRDSDSP